MLIIDRVGRAVRLKSYCSLSFFLWAEGDNDE
jgi:hypothetical protein